MATGLMKNELLGVIVYFVAFGVSILLMVIGFIVPPTGAIDGSVLSAGGELLGFTLVWRLPEMIKAAKSVKVNTPAGASVEIECDDDIE